MLGNPDGSKLSKRQLAVNIDHFKERGFSPEALINLVTYSGGAFKRNGVEFECLTIDELIKRVKSLHLYF